MVLSSSGSEIKKKKKDVPFFGGGVKISPLFHDIDLNFQICQGYGCHPF